MCNSERKNSIAESHGALSIVWRLQKYRYWGKRRVLITAKRAYNAALPPNPANKASSPPG